MAAKNRRARNGGHGLLACIDQVGIDLGLYGKRANPQHAVLRLQPNLLIGRHMVGHQRGDADAEVDVKPVFEFVCRACGHLVLAPAHVKPLMFR